MFGIGLPEIAVILLVAVVVFGPDKLPDLAKQAAQLIRQMKNLADGARDELRTQLGPEYADLELRDLDPRTLVRRHVLSALDDEDKPTEAAPVAAARPGLFSAYGNPVDLVKHFDTHRAALDAPASQN